MKADRMIEELTEVLHTQQARARVIAALPAELLLKRPTPEAWNVLEVFEHLNLSSGVYVRGLEDVFTRKAASLRPQNEFVPGLLGDWFTTGLEPKPGGAIKWRMRTLKMFDPARNAGASLDSITRFIDLCTRLMILLEKARTTDLNKLRVTSSLGPLIRFKAGDALRFPIAHQRRHFLQIERILAMN
jgi:hypothetical protein